MNGNGSTTDVSKAGADTAGADTAGADKAGTTRINATRHLRARLRRELPRDVFIHRPHRFLYWIPMMALIATATAVLATVDLPPFAAIMISLALGGVYGSLFFFGHEVGHGSIVKSRILQDLVLYSSLGIYCTSPHLWRIWHNQVHHAYTNHEVSDPDTWGTLDSYRAFPAARIGFKLSPGSGNWASVLYLFTWFTVHAQHVLWSKSRRAPGFGRLSRRRAAIDSLLWASFWLLLGTSLGPYRALLCVIIPMLVANAIIMSYISTNHMMSPMVEGDDVLDSSMSVTSWRIVDAIHFHFSHHVEHHLFPSMGSDQSPHIRRLLERIAGHRYLAPAHWRALLMLYRTPRVYVEPRVLYDPVRDTRVSTDRVATALQRKGSSLPGKGQSAARLHTGHCKTNAVVSARTATSILGKPDV
ncbi:MAG: fatty acid desaturase [Proteobacteria bacterium]|nr:fatty acid desaturase [Pseudomonadota bacterium]